jgi:hypothetical protein
MRMRIHCVVEHLFASRKGSNVLWLWVAGLRSGESSTEGSTKDLFDRAQAEHVDEAEQDAEGGSRITALPGLRGVVGDPFLLL